jgi:hypothetical protein
MDEHNQEQHTSDVPAGQNLQEGSLNNSQKQSDTLAGGFAYDQPYHEDVWEEESIPLSGEINATDTFITGEQFRDDPFERLEGPSETMDQSPNEDPFDPYRSDELTRENGLSHELAEAGTEFGGELSPAAGAVVNPVAVSPVVSRIDRTTTQENFQAADNGGLQVETPEGNTTFGWVAIILAIASLFYWPAVLGPAAAVIGVLAYLNGNRTLGAWSVVLGLLAIAAHLFLIPYYS